jgi:hypothetical protein
VAGAAAIAAFLAERCGRGDLVARPTAANRQPAVAMLRRTGDRGLVPYRLVLLDVQGGRIVALHAFATRPRRR